MSWRRSEMLTSNEIRPSVELIVKSYTKGVKLRPEDQPVIDAGVDLVVSVLECLHDLTWYVSLIEGAERNRR